MTSTPTSAPTPETTSTAPATVRTRHRRGPLVAIAVVLALFGAACTPSPDDPGSIDIPFGPITVPLPPIGAVPPPVTVDLILCQVGYVPPAITIRNATVTIPGLRINPNTTEVGVPNVSVNLPQNNLHLPGAYLSCLGLGGATEVALVIPAQVHVRSAMLNLQTGVLSLNNPTITVTGVGVNLFGLGLIVPMPPFPIQLPTITVPLAGLAGGGAAAG